MAEPITLLVTDDHTLFRTGLVRLIGDYPELTVVGEAASADEAVQKAEALAPDVILMDIDMPDEDGIAATRRIRRILPDARIIMLTMYGSEGHVLDAIRAGAYGYLLKDASADDLVGTIRTVAQGGAVINPHLARRLLDEFAQQPEPSSPTGRSRANEDLSPREAQILALIAAGETSRSIAQRLFLSENTVKRHTSNIYQKLHVKHRSQAAAEAVRRGLVVPEQGRATEPRRGT
ncbi:MAG: response regulator transcription factor [Dehalococcoidia bacterium]